jgi:hypothetical protein
MKVKDMAEVKVKEDNLEPKSWAKITREERFFCAELFFLIRKKGEARKPFFKLLAEKLSLKIEESQYDSFDVGFEVCFYRDVLWEHGKKVRETLYPPKRTFDLALMSNDDLYLIEAKAQGRFTIKDLATIKRDKTRIKKLCKRLKVKLPEVHTIALVSSGYRDKLLKKLLKKGRFEQVVTWAEVAEKYQGDEHKRAQEAFERANAVYGN